MVPRSRAVREHCEEPGCSCLDRHEFGATHARAPFLGRSPPPSRDRSTQSALYAYLAHLLVNRFWYLASPVRHHGAPESILPGDRERRIPLQRLRWRRYVEHFGQGTFASSPLGKTRRTLFRFATGKAGKRPSPERVRTERCREALRAFSQPRTTRGSRTWRDPVSPGAVNLCPFPAGHPLLSRRPHAPAPSRGAGSPRRVGRPRRDRGFGGAPPTVRGPSRVGCSTSNDLRGLSLS